MMNRKAFLGRFAAGFTALLVPTHLSAITQAKKIKILACEVRGLYYYDYKEIKRNLNIGDRLQLIAEPDNEHDAQAVEVWFGAYKLGYLPRELNLAAANFLANSMPLEAKIVELGKLEVGVEVRLMV